MAITLTYEQCYGPEKFQRRQTQRAKATAKSVAIASTFEIGQMVKNKNRPFDRNGPISGPVVAIDGDKVAIERPNGMICTFVGSALIPA